MNPLMTGKCHDNFDIAIYSSLVKHSVHMKQSFLEFPKHLLHKFSTEIDIENWYDFLKTSIKLHVPAFVSSGIQLKPNSPEFNTTLPSMK